MQTKVRIPDEIWKQFIEITDKPSETIRELIITFIKENQKSKKCNTNSLEKCITNSRGQHEK